MGRRFDLAGLRATPIIIGFRPAEGCSRDLSLQPALAWLARLPTPTPKSPRLGHHGLRGGAHLRRFAPRRGLRALDRRFSRHRAVWTAVILSFGLLLSVAMVSLSMRLSARTPWTAACAADPASGAPTSPTPWGPRPPPATSSDADPRPGHLVLLPRLRGRPAAATAQIVAACQEERFSRKKHDAGFPARAVKYVLREAGITPEQLDAVGFYDKPLLKFERMLSTYVATFPRSFNSFRKAMPVWIKEKLWVPSIIRKRAAALQGPHPVRRAPHEPRGLLLPGLALRGGGHPHRGRRGRVGHGVVRRGPRQRHHALQGDPLPAQPGAALQRLHLLPGLQGEQRRVQGDGAGALRQAGALRPHHEGDGAPEGRTAPSSST